MQSKLIYISEQIEESVQKAQENDKNKDDGKYKYLHKSVCVNGEFDLRFDKIKNSLITQRMSSAFTFLKYKFFNKSGKHQEPTTKEDFELLERQMPILKPIFKHDLQTGIRYTWIGHSTAVIQVGQDNLLIDPVFAAVCFPTQFLGPRRYRDPACSIKELCKIDLVLVSHDHYDHLDEHALNEINQLYHPIFVAGLGSKGVFPAKSQLHQMDWMDQVEITVNSKKYSITFVPACHWSRRGFFDYNTRLWGGFVIKTPYGQKIFYSGDTAYTEVFKEIGDKYGPFDLSILPIGAYEPRQLLEAQHIDPEQAVKIHLDLKSKKSVGVHWGTFPLGFEAFNQPKDDLEKAKKKLGVKKDKFITIRHGDSFVV